MFSGGGVSLGWPLCNVRRALIIQCSTIRIRHAIIKRSVAWSGVAWSGLVWSDLICSWLVRYLYGTVRHDMVGMVSSDMVFHHMKWYDKALIYTRHLFGWLETRLAQITLNYLDLS